MSPVLGEVEQTGVLWFAPPMIESGLHDRQFMRAAYEQALKSYNEGGLPIGAVVVENGTIPGNIEFLRSRGVEVVLLDDPDCVALMDRFKKERPEPPLLL